MLASSCRSMTQSRGYSNPSKDAALVQKAGGGTGFTFDRLRPTGDRVASSGGTTSGPMSFVRVFDESTNAIQQGASRRGANMGMMAVDHPDILKFIMAKAQAGVFENFNLSVKVTDAFMQALNERPNEPHVVANPRDGKKYLIPREVDIHRYGIQDLPPAACDREGLLQRGGCLGPDRGLCPCHRRTGAVLHRPGQPRQPYAVAGPDRGHQSLRRAAAAGLRGLQPWARSTWPGSSIATARRVRWDGLRNTIHWAIIFLDDVIDVASYPLPRIEQITRGNRKIGLGIMGFADALVLLGISYNSRRGGQSCRGGGRFLSRVCATKPARNWLPTAGCFPNWAGSTWDTKHHGPMRNATCTTIAPTGSISILARCSSGDRADLRRGQPTAGAGQGIRRDPSARRTIWADRDAGSLPL